MNLFTPMAYNNAWANYRLISACEALSQEDFEAERVSFFPTLKKTLNHNLLVDLYYVDALEGRHAGPGTSEDHAPAQTIADLKAAQSKVDRRLIEFCRELTSDGAAVLTRIDRRDHVQEERTDRVLLHLFQHQIHHRGQAHAMLAGTNIKPPQLDEFFMSSDRARGLRTSDFEALGWTEEEIWGSSDG